jgi:hypothetical protein
MHFLSDEKETGLYGIARRPKGHKRVRYEVILANYAIIRAVT